MQATITLTLAFVEANFYTQIMSRKFGASVEDLSLEYGEGITREELLREREVVAPVQGTVEVVPIKTEVPDNREFMSNGACKDYPPSRFVLSRGAQASDVDAAKAICETCPVIEPCKEYALRRPSLKGVWGGTSENDRKQIRRERKQARNKHN